MARLKIDLNFSLKRLDLVTKGLVTTSLLGGYASAFKGQGLEFADYRKYNQGVDDAGMIDWKASRRVNDLLVKEYVEERNLDVIFLVDVSEKMLAGSTKKLKAEYIAEFVASFGYSMLKAGDSVGIVLFSDKIVSASMPQSGMKQFYVLTDKLSNTSNYGGWSDIDRAIDYVFKNGTENSLVILISDFVEPIKSERLVKQASRKFDFISMVVRDKRDMSLPKGMGEVIIKDPYSGEVMLVDPKKVWKEYERMNKKDVNDVKSLMKKSGGDFLFLETDKGFEKPLIEFFKRREAEWR